MAVKEIGSNYLYPMQSDYASDSKVDDKRNKTSHTSEQMDGVSYEKTIPDSVLAELNSIQDLEKQNGGTKSLDRFGTDGAESKQLEEEAEKAADEESAAQSGQVSVNAGKIARMIAAAKTTSQLRAVMAKIKGDMQEVKAGIEKGWCDRSEMDKVNSLMSMAQNRMGQVEDREATPEEENMFAMASLM